MNVLSVFDGMSCGQIAFERAGIKVDRYYASEIDKYAIQVAQRNYPDTIQLGDINGWRSWKLPKIDILIGGSPCQGFSFAGKGLNFDDPRSRLFFVYVDILKHLREKNPEIKFLLENVRMRKDHQAVISDYLGVEPILIDSALVSAQSRNRLYWTNIPDVEQPEDRHIYLRDILEDEVPDEFWLSKASLEYMDRHVRDGRTHWDFAHYSDVKDEKSAPVVANFYKGVPYNVLKVGNIYPSRGQNGNVFSVDGKSPALSAGVGVRGRGIGSSNAPKILIARQVGRRLTDGTRDDYNYSIPTVQRIEITRDDGKSGTLSTVQKDNLVVVSNAPIERAVRRLMPIECERLQTVPDGYTEGVSNTQRYKMLGNGWTVDVISHIFRHIPREL